MAYGLLLPVAPITGLPCSGHGICIPGTVHSVQACGTPPVPYSIKIKEWTCWWPPQPLIPYTALNPLKALVLTNGLPTMTLGDVFVQHICMMIPAIRVALLHYRITNVCPALPSV